MSYLYLNVEISDVAAELSSDPETFADLLSEMHSKFYDLDGFANQVANNETAALNEVVAALARAFDLIE